MLQEESRNNTSNLRTITWDLVFSEVVHLGVEGNGGKVQLWDVPPAVWFGTSADPVTDLSGQQGEEDRLVGYPALA